MGVDCTRSPQTITNQMVRLDVEVYIHIHTYVLNQRKLIGLCGCRVYKYQINTNQVDRGLYQHELFGFPFMFTILAFKHGSAGFLPLHAQQLYTTSLH